MKALIVTHKTLFSQDAADKAMLVAAASLQTSLIRAGHQAEILRIPIRCSSAPQAASQLFMVRALEMSNVDHVIALSSPAWCIRHPRKTIWAFDSLHWPYGYFGPQAAATTVTDEDASNAHREANRLFHTAQRQAFTESRKVFASSTSVQRVLAHDYCYNADLLAEDIACDDIDWWSVTVEALLR